MTDTQITDEALAEWYRLGKIEAGVDWKHPLGTLEARIIRFMIEQAFSAEKQRADAAVADAELLSKTLQNRDADWAEAEKEHDAVKAERDRMREALEWYRDQLCEGFCEGFTPRICEAALQENPTGGDCAGCKAVLALASIEKES